MTNEEYMRLQPGDLVKWHTGELLVYLRVKSASPYYYEVFFSVLLNLSTGRYGGDAILAPGVTISPTSTYLFKMEDGEGPDPTQF